MARTPYKPLEPTVPCEPEENSCNPVDRFVRAMVSDRAGNSISQQPDGLFAPAIVYRENTLVEAADESIEVVEGETADHFRKFTVGTKISLDNGNILQLNADGLFVSVDPEIFPEVPLLVQGSLYYTPTIPGQGVVQITGERNVIRITNDLTNIVLHYDVADVFEKMQEIYLVQDDGRNVPIHLIWETGFTFDGVAGPGSRTFAAGASVHILRHQANEWLLLAGSGVAEALFDGQPYVRKDGVWVVQHKQVLPALVLGTPADPAPLDVSRSQFNRIVQIQNDFTSLDLKRQYLGNYQTDFEATYVKESSFLINVPMGVMVNGFSGPLAFRVEAKPKGCVLKLLNADNWLIMGSLQQDGAVTPLPPITTLEFPGSGTFKAQARLMDGTLLYDMTANSNMHSSVNGLKNIVIAAIILDEKTAVLDMKDQVYLASYGTGITDNLSDLMDGDMISYRDMISLLLHNNFEDIAVMASLLLGAGVHANFTVKMNEWAAQIENPLISSFFGAALVIADPPAITNVIKLNDWLQHIETYYEPIRTMLRSESRVFTIFGANNRTYTTTNTDEYLNWLRVDYGMINDLGNPVYPFWGAIQKLEMPIDIPVYFSVLGCVSELERHWAVSSFMMSIEDDFPWMTNGVTDFDLDFSDVSVLIGNSVTLLDRSNVANMVSASPTGYTHTDRATKGWIKSYDLNGVAGYVTIYDNASIRMGAEEFTIEMFFRGAGAQTNHTFFAKDGINIDKRSYMLRLEGLNFKLYYTLVGDLVAREWTAPISADLKAVLMNGARRHICLQRTDDKIQLFINGRQFGADLDLPTNAILQDCSMPLNIGCNGDPIWIPAPTAGMYGKFKLDNFRVTKKVARYPLTGFAMRSTPFKNGSGT